VRARQAEGEASMLAAIGRKIDTKIPANATPREAAALLRDNVSKQYTEAVTTVPLSAYHNFAAPIAQITSKLPTIPGQSQGAISGVLNDIVQAENLIRSAPSARVAGDKWKEIDSFLGTLGAGYAPIKDAWRKSFHDIAGPEASHKMLNADLSHKATTAVEKALGSSDAATSLQLVRSLRKHDLDPAAIRQDASKYVGDTSNLSSKAAEINKIAEAGNELATKNIAPWVIPQVAAAAGIGASTLGIPTMASLLAAATAGTASAYTKSMGKYMSGQLGNKQRLIAQSLREGLGKNIARRAAGAYATEQEKR